MSETRRIWRRWPYRGNGAENVHRLCPRRGHKRRRAAAIVKAVTNFTDAKMLAELSEDLGEAMVGVNEQEINLLMAQRGQ